MLTQTYVVHGSSYKGQESYAGVIWQPSINRVVVLCIIMALHYTSHEKLYGIIMSSKWQPFVQSPVI